MAVAQLWIVRCFEPMTARQRLGVKILAADVLIGAGLLFGGIVRHPVGPPPPPPVTVSESTTTTGSVTTFNYHVMAYTRPYQTRWMVAAPLFGVLVVGVVLVVTPKNEKRT